MSNDQIMKSKLQKYESDIVNLKNEHNRELVHLEKELKKGELNLKNLQATVKQKDSELEAVKRSKDCEIANFEIKCQKMSEQNQELVEKAVNAEKTSKSLQIENSKITHS